MRSKREFISFKVWMWNRPDDKDHSKDYIKEELVILPLDSLKGVDGVRVCFTDADYSIQDKASKCFVKHWYIEPAEVDKLLSKLNIV